MAYLQSIFLVSSGTCINNTSVMMFKKGSFEIGGTIYPVAIKVRHQYHCFCSVVDFSLNHAKMALGKLHENVSTSLKRCSVNCGTISLLQYDPQFGDAFWNSAKYNMVSYLLRMMTSWAIVVNVWYLPPMTRQVGCHSLYTVLLLLLPMTNWSDLMLCFIPKPS